MYRFRERVCRGKLPLHSLKRHPFTVSLLTVRCLRGTPSLPQLLRAQIILSDFHSAEGVVMCVFTPAPLARSWSSDASCLLPRKRDVRGADGNYALTAGRPGRTVGKLEGRPPLPTAFALRADASTFSVSLIPCRLKQAVLSLR